MEVHVAENGQSFMLDCQPTSSIEMLQNVLAPVTGISVHDQMLMCGDTRLEPNFTLMHYKLPAENRHVVLFNRCRFLAESPCPLPEVFEPILAVFPQPPTVASSGHHVLDDASDPALKALPSYERQFKYHYQKGQAIVDASELRFQACRRLLREQQVQELALETARGNLDFYYKIIDKSYADFMKMYTRQHKQHSELLANLEGDFERLRSCRLHPGLRSQNLKTLLDCVKEGRLRKWAEDCSFSIRQLNAKVADLKNLYGELQRNVQYLFRAAPAVNVRELGSRIDDSVHFTEEQAGIIQFLSKDVNTVKKLVDDCVSAQFSVSLRPHDAVSALGPMYDLHDENHLPRIVSCDIELSKLLESCQYSKNAMSRFVHSHLQSVAALQSNLKDMRNQLAAFKEAMNRQEADFTEFKIVRRMGSAYKACLAEVVRRKAGMKLYLGQAGQLAEKLARKREAEVARREEFLRVQSVYFSREVLVALGLYENPSQCVVNIAPFDTNLLDIDIQDVERYAPESLVGPMLKISGLSGRGDSHRSFSDRGQEHSSDGREDVDAEPEDDESSSEIAGTSKLEVENAWLKAELASAVARLCQVDPDFECEVAGDSEDLKPDPDSSHHTRSTSQKTVEALRLKDDYAGHLHTLLSTRQSQCRSYEKRIRELEQRLTDQHLQMQKYSSPYSEPRPLDRQDQAADSENSVMTALTGGGVPEPMDEGVSALAASEDANQNQANREAGSESRTAPSGSGGDRIDETMSDVLGGGSGLNSAIGELWKERSAGESSREIGLEKSSSVDNLVDASSSLNELEPVESEPVDVSEPLFHSEEVGTFHSEEVVSEEKTVDVSEGLLREKEEQVAVLQSALRKRTDECAAMEERLKAAFAEVGHLRSEMENNAELLSECQMNCAHLENRLHEAREESRKNLCAAESRLTQYNALRASSVRLRGLMERLRTCISTSGTGFADSLRALAVSLSSPTSTDSVEHVEFRTSIRILAEKVGALVGQQAVLLERCTIAETSQGHLTKELEIKNEALKNLQSKQKGEKQAGKA